MNWASLELSSSGWLSLLLVVVGFLLFFVFLLFLTGLKPFFGVLTTMLIFGVSDGVVEVCGVVVVVGGFFLGVVNCWSFPLGGGDDGVVALFWRCSGSSLMTNRGVSGLVGVALVVVMSLRFFRLLGLSLMGVLVDILLFCC